MSLRLPRTAWDWFPWAIWISLLVVIVVNAGMIWAALSTFPGSAGEDGFDASNSYNTALRAAARAEALGWHIALDLHAGNRPELALSGPAGTPLPGAAVTTSAERPVGPPERRALVWHPAAPGHYVSDPLPRGRWILRIAVRAEGHEVTATRAITAEERRQP
ncbi:MAG: FixH family protein [Rhodospirillales bacterium]|nr:FixH family protein [Rhodospirillales bacterium]